MMIHERRTVTSRTVTLDIYSHKFVDLSGFDLLFLAHLWITLGTICVHAEEKVQNTSELKSQSHCSLFYLHHLISEVIYSLSSTLSGGRINHREVINIRLPTTRFLTLPDRNSLWIRPSLVLSLHRCVSTFNSRLKLKRGNTRLLPGNKSQLQELSEA